MSADISEQMKEILDNIPEEEFDRMWNEIKEMGLGGPTVDEYYRYLEANKELLKQYEKDN